MNKMMGDLTSGDRADYEYDRQKDDKAHRYFNALEMLKRDEKRHAIKRVRRTH